jgi:hypothetical protein
MPLKLFSFAAISAVALTLTASAHHSHGNYDITKWMNFEGTVKEVHLINPHSWIYVEVKDEKGEPKILALEATNPTGLQRKGIKREDVQPGDRIKVRSHPLRDGGNGAILGFVTPLHGDPARGHGVEKEWD